ncbi:MAG: hypothetical protein WC446_07465 [Candidatus Paceibacterota bacterium]|jgi:hypothetical protein|nr:hypothetical protein [Salinivirgaceae bacterium]
MHPKNTSPSLFFYMARYKSDVSKDDVAMALKHIDQILKTTYTYINPDWTSIDRANRNVLDYMSSQEQ